MPKLAVLETMVKIPDYCPVKKNGDYWTARWHIRLWINEIPEKDPNDHYPEDMEERDQIYHFRDLLRDQKFDTKRELAEFLIDRCPEINAIEVLNTNNGIGKVFYPEWP